MAEQISQDVVTQAQSVGDPAPSDVSADTATNPAASAAAAATPAPTKSDIPSESAPRNFSAVDESKPTVDNSGLESSNPLEGLVSSLRAQGSFVGLTSTRRTRVTQTVPQMRQLLRQK